MKISNILLGAGMICLVFLLAAPCASGALDFSKTVTLARDNSQSIQKRVTAILDLGASKDERASEPLLNILKDPAEPGRIRVSAVMALTDLGKPRTEILTALESAYRDPTAGSNLLYAILISLGKMKASESLPILSEALSSPESMIRLKAAQALGMVQSDESLHLLMTHLEREKDRIVRAGTVRALGQSQNAITEKALIRALRSDPEPVVRNNAAIMLGKFRTLGPDADAALEAARQDSSPVVRHSVKRIRP